MPGPFLATAAFALQAASFVANLFGGTSAAKRQREIGRMLAADAMKRGEENVFAFRGDAARLLGRQRAVMAAAGTDVTQGSAAAIRQETEGFINRDLRQLRLNAMREARALRKGANAQASQFQSQAFASAIANLPTLMTSGRDAWQALGLGGVGTTATSTLRPLSARQTATTTDYMPPQPVTRMR